MPQSTEIFEQHRPGLFRLAYGMLGRVAPAQDAVQESYLRWQNQDIKQIRSPKAWLSKVVNRICLDEIKSARNQREQYIGPDLPEPLLAERCGSPQDALEIAESLSMALLVILDRLTPVQRAVFLLREVFDYDYAYRIEFKDVNGEPGMLLWVEEQLYSVWSFHIEEGKIMSIYAVLNPDKLVHVNGFIKTDLRN